MATDELFRSLTADTKPADLERSLLARIGKRGSGGFDATFDRDGRGLVHAACAAGNPGCVLLLLLHGGNPNLRDRHGITPLHECCFAVYSAGTVVASVMIGLLLAHGGSLHIKADDPRRRGIARWDGRMSPTDIIKAFAAAEPTLEDFGELVWHMSDNAPTEAVVCFEGLETGGAVKAALAVTDEIIAQTGRCPRFIFCGNITPPLLAALEGIPTHAVVLQCQGTTIAERIAFCQAKLSGLSGRITVVAQEDSLPEVRAYFEARGSERAARILPDWLPHLGEVAFVQALPKAPFFFFLTSSVRDRDASISAATLRAQVLAHGQWGKAIDDLRRAFVSKELGKYTPTKVARAFILDELLQDASSDLGVEQPEQRPYSQSPVDLEALALAAMDDSDTADSDDDALFAAIDRSPTIRFTPASLLGARAPGSPQDEVPDPSTDMSAARTVSYLSTSGKVKVTILTYNVAMLENMARLADPTDTSFLADVIGIIRLTKSNVIMLTGIGTYKVDGERVNFAETLASELGVEFRYSESRKLPDGTGMGVAFLSPFPILQKIVFRYKTAECVPSTALSVMISIDFTDGGRRRSGRARTACTYVWCTVTDIDGRDGKVHEQQMRELDIHFKSIIKSDSPFFLGGTFRFPKEERSAAYKYLTSKLRANLCDLLTFAGRNSSHTRFSTRGVPTSTWGNRATYPSRHTDDDAAEPSKRWDYFFCNDHKLLPKEDLHQEVCDIKMLNHLATTSSHLPVAIHWI